MPRRSLQILAAAATGLFLLAAPAMAQTCTTPPAGETCIAFPSGISGTSVDVTATSAGISDEGVDTTGFPDTSSIAAVPVIGGATNYFWCTDLPEGLIQGGNGGDYYADLITTPNSGPKYPSTPTTTQANDVTTLLYNGEVNSSYGNELGNQGVSSTWLAAWQLAIWAVLYDGSDLTTGFSLTSSSNNFYAKSGQSGGAGTAVTDAQTLLTCLISGGSGCSGWGSGSGYATTNYIPVSGDNQSIAYLTNNSFSSTPVPEPPSLALLAAGLLALPLVRRRRAA